MSDKKAIIDFGAIYWTNWHRSDGDAVSTAARNTLKFVRELYADYGVENIIVALDAPPYKRSELYPEYKRNRSEKSQSSIHELSKAIEKILDDGVRTAKCQGYEADDVIATLVKNEKHDVYGVDKDLLQCTDLIEPYTRELKTSESRLKIKREQVVDYLTLIGDKSDNIPGVKGVGDITAKKLLSAFGSIKGIYAALHDDETQFKKTAGSLKEAASWIDTSYQLVKLADDLELEYEQREAVKSENGMTEQIEVADVREEKTADKQSVAIQVSHDQLSYKQSLEPIGMTELWKISNAFIDSQLYSKFPNAEAVMATIMRGRSLGLDATTSLELIHVIKGKPSMSAAGMIGLVKTSPECEYIQCTERTAEKCTWETLRKGNPKPTVLAMTLEECKSISPDKFLTQLKAQPATMIMWKAGAAICRMEYPDVINGMYAVEEMED